MSETAFLLCRPVMGYEESIEPRLIFTSKLRAENARMRIINATDKFIKTLPPWPDGCDSLDARIESPVWEQREEMSKAFRAPYGWVFCTSDLWIETERLDRSCIDITELPKNPLP